MEGILNNHQPCKQWDKLPTSTGERRISEPSRVWSLLNYFPPVSGGPLKWCQAFRMNSIDTSWLDGMIREKTVKVKYEILDKVMTWVSANFSDPYGLMVTCYIHDNM